MPRVAAAPLGVLIGFSIAACFTKPGPPDRVVRDSGTDTGNDAIMKDAMTDAITDAITDAMKDALTPISDGAVIMACVLHDFAGSGSNCGAWATLTAGGASRQTGALSLYVTDASNPARATCETSASAAVLRATIDINTVPMAMTESTSFYVAQSGMRFGATLSTGTGSTFIVVDCNGLVPGNTQWIPASMHYVRLVVAPPMTLHVQTSSDNTFGTWVTLGTCTAPSALDSVTVGLELQRSGGSNEGIPTFDSLEICL